jgi:hypothetical protein
MNGAEQPASLTAAPIPSGRPEGRGEWTPTLRFRLARVDWADHLPGDDEALHVRQVIAQDVLGEELWANERVRAFFAPWFTDLDQLLSALKARVGGAA